MPHHTDNLSALIGSRICHDLISPVGAVTNGLEMLELSGLPRSPELALVSESASNASAKIRLFRLAFGFASAEQQIGSEEMHSILSAVYAGSRTELQWHANGTYPRALAQIVMLAVLCTERAMAYGGRLMVEETRDIWSLTAASERLNVDESVWSLLSGHAAPQQAVEPADVQFVLAPRLLTEQGRVCRYTYTDTSVSLSF